ncbi:MAG: hypothetical protein ACQEUT_20485 [Bacillota bacterium]
MKKSIYIVLFSSVLLLVGCNPKTMEEVFHDEMKNKDVDEYKLVEKVEEDNVILYTSQTKDDDYYNYHPKLAFFTKSEDKWLWKRTNVCRLDEWSVNLDGDPYIWCGTLTEPRHEKVIVGDTEAEMIEMNDGVRRVWYHMSKNRNEEIKVILTDGTEEWLKEVIK